MSNVIEMPVGPRQVPDVISYQIGKLAGVAARSKDPNNQVAAIAVGPDGETRSEGYNGFPRRVKETAKRWDRRSGEKYKWVVHAEANAIYNAARVGIPLKGCVMYVSFLPCIECAKAICQSGFVGVVIDADNHDRVQTPKWEEDKQRVLEMFHESAVSVVWSRRK